VAIRATRRVLGRLLAALVAATSAACSLLVSLDGLSGDAPATDASSDGTLVEKEAAAPDAPLTLVDARSDAVVDAGPFCKRAPHDFCSDFDEGQPVATGWSQAYAVPQDAGRADLDITTATSPPACAFVRTFAGFGNRGFTLEQSLGERVTTAAHFSFDARVDSDTSDGSLLIFALVFRATGIPDYEMAVVVRGTSLEIQENLAVDGGTFDPAPLAPTMQVGAWTHFEGDVLFSAAPHVVVRVDGVQALDKPLQAYAHAGGLLARAGTIYANVSAETHVRFDNVTVDVD
jgi:hypothetical protein